LADVNILVAGNSTTYTVKPARVSREDGPYPDLLPALLPGGDVTVRCEARWFGMIHRAMADYERVIRPPSPDVVIVSYGINECMPRLLPNRFLAHVLEWQWSRTRARDLYKRQVVERAWPPLRWIQRRGARVLGQRTWRLSPYRFRHELGLLIGTIRAELGSLVLVMGIAPPGDNLMWLMPGMDRRRDRYDAIIQDVVRAVADPSVRFIDVGPVVAEFGLAEALPDGIHFSVAAHRRVAELLAAEISVRGEGPPRFDPRSRSG
jgi:lysophospholipase L1-like esterase